MNFRKTACERVRRNLIRGLVKLKKIREKIGSARQHPPTPHIHVVFVYHVQKNTIWGLNHPPTSEFFSDFFSLTRPLNEMNRALGHLCAHIG